MTIWSFIFGVIALLVIAFVGLCVLVAVTNTRQLEEENKRLKEDLIKARSTRVKKEYKKVKEVK